MTRTNRPANEMTLEELRSELEETRIQLEMRDTVIYCPKCGACGEDGCCSTSMCAYVDEYRGSYKRMVEDWEQMFEGIKLYRQFKKTGAEEDRKAVDDWEKAFNFGGTSESLPV